MPRSPRSVQTARALAVEISGAPGEAGELPITPLGRNRQTNYYLDYGRQLIELTAEKHGRLGLQQLFGDDCPWLWKFAPRVSKEGTVTGWRPEIVAEHLIRICSRKGIWMPETRERGRGAWRGDNGELILHVGDRLLSFPAKGDPWADHDATHPGVIGAHVYPAGDPTPQPALAKQSAGPGGPAEKLLRILETWNWRRPGVDPVLLLGWIGCAMIAGALEWRPAVWLTGEKGTGKSALQKLIRYTFSEDSIIDVVDTTAAGIWQEVRQQTLPVAVDELEAEEDPRKAQSIIKLARVAASGGRMRRGGADHNGVQFTVRCCFLFSSVLIPPLLPQDVSRLAILELRDLLPLAPPPVLDPKELRTLGQQLRRRLVDAWPRLEATLAFFRQQLAEQGHSARGQDQFGALLALADMLLHDGEPTAESAGEWAHLLAAAQIGETAHDVPDWARCRDFLLDYLLEAEVSRLRRPVSRWLSIALGRFEADDPQAKLFSSEQMDLKREAARALETIGIKLVGSPTRLAVATGHRGLDQVFAGTQWAARSGAHGVYVQSLRRVPGAEVARDPPVYWFSGRSARATLLPLEEMLPAERAARVKPAYTDQLAE